MKNGAEKMLLLARARLVSEGEQERHLMLKKEKLEHDLLTRSQNGKAYRHIVDEIRQLNMEIAKIKRLNKGMGVSEDKSLVDEMIHKQLRFGG